MTTRVIETVVTNADKPPCRTAEQMTQLCCEKTAALQCCEEVVNGWPGYTAKEIIDHLGLVLDDQGRDKDGRYVNIQMQPRKTPCGEQVTKYDTSQKNCCEGVAALAWNMTVTPDVLPHGKSIIIAWTGSDGRQVEVVTTSNATWFSDGRKTALGHGNSIELFSGPTFCGSTAVTVRDGCSTATVIIRSDLGQWLDIGPVCALSGAGVNVGGRNIEKISGNIKQIDTQIMVYSWVSPPFFFGFIQPYGNGGYPWPSTACPPFASSVCSSATYEACLGAVGLPVSGGLCLDANIEGITILGPQIFENGWLNDGGLVGYSCGTSSGAAPLKYLAYLQSSAIRAYKWSC